MCGRFTLTASPDRIAELLALAGIEPFPPRYNIAPTQPVLLVSAVGGERRGVDQPDRSAHLARWGLIPSWVKDPGDFPLLYNARAETAATKNAFRGAVRYRRCLIPASGFYEWKRHGSGAGRGRKSDAYFIKPADGEPFAFAGLMETYLASDGSEIDTAAILTRAANAAIAPIHDRMPVVVSAHDHQRWLDCRNNEPASVADILRAANDDFFVPVRVSDKVNKVANVGAEVQSPLDGSSEDASGASAKTGSRPAAPPKWRVEGGSGDRKAQRAAAPRRGRASDDSEQPKLL